MVSPMGRRPKILIGVAAAAAVGISAAVLTWRLGVWGHGRTYSNPSLNFSLTVPEGWTVRDTSGPVALVVTGPAADDGSRPNVNVVVEPSAATLDEFARQTLESLQHTYKDKGFKLIAEGPQGDRRKAPHVYATFEESATGRTVKQRQLYVIGNGRAYTVTATATPETFAEYEPEFEAVFRSFRAGE